VPNGRKREPYQLYTRGVFRSLKMRATRLPQEGVALGDVGIMEDGVFERRTTLRKLGIRFSTRPGRTTASFDYSSRQGVSFSTKAAGETSNEFQSVGKAKAGVLIRFSRAGAVVFTVPSSRIVSISNLNDLQADLRRLDRSGVWERRWVVVTKIVEAESATILVSGSARAKVELRADAHIVAGSVDLADVGAGFSRASSQDMEIKLVAEGDLVPLYLVHELRTTRTARHPVKGKRTLRRRRGVARKPAKKATARRRATKKASRKKATRRRRSR
jgi:hypothetical protein